MSAPSASRPAPAPVGGDDERNVRRYARPIRGGGVLRSPEDVVQRLELVAPGVELVRFREARRAEEACLRQELI